MSATVTAWTPRSPTRRHAVSRMCARALRWVVVTVFDTCKTCLYCTRVKCVGPGVDRMVWRSAYEPIETGDATLHASIAATAARVGDRVGADRRPVRRRRSPTRRSPRASSAPPRGSPRAGCGPGDVLALWAPNSPEWVDRRPRRDGGRRHGHRRQPGRAPSASWPRSWRTRARRSSSPSGATVSVDVARTAGVREVVALDDVEARGRGPRGRARPIARGRSAALLERHHRAAQGRDAHPRECRGRRRPGARRAQARAARHPRRRRSLRSRHGVRHHAGLPR